jgi:predicted nucleic acid-binding protein
VRTGIGTMSERLVVDASAALGILLREPGSEEVRRRLADALGGELLVPGHFWLEVTNVLLRQYGRAPDDVIAVLRELDEMQLVTAVLDRPAILHGLELMARRGLTAYDAAYLALADVADALLLTLDGRLAAAAADRAAVRPRPRAHEDAEPYGPPVGVPDWTVHGRYLAELRYAAGNS